MDAMSRALHQISKFPFSAEIEILDLPHRFVEPAFFNYNRKFDPVKHVSHFNQSMALHARDEALMSKVFLSSFVPIAMRWFDSPMN